MPRIYCDSNVFRLLKPSSNQYNQEVWEIFQRIRKNALLVFSDTHLDDLSSSSEHHRIEDLKLMEEYTENFYMWYDQIDKRMEYLLATPNEAYKLMDYKLYKAILDKPHDLKKLTNISEDDEINKEFESWINSYWSLPIGSLGYPNSSLEADDKWKQLIENIIPGYNREMTMGKMLEAMQPFTTSFLHDPKKFDKIRKDISTYLEDQDFSFQKWGMDFNERFQNTPWARKFTEIIKGMLLDTQINDFWLQFQYAYNALEMFNVTAERAGGKRKLNSLLELSKDCNHLFNAIHCDYFISNDKGLLTKAAILFEIFQVTGTKILSIADLKDFELAKDRDESVATVIQNLRSLSNLRSNGDRDYCSVNPSFLFYFDEFMYNRNCPNSFILYNKANEGRPFLCKEIQFVANKIVLNMGVDLNGRGSVSIDEIANSTESEPLRLWKLTDDFVVLLCDPALHIALKVEGDRMKIKEGL